MLPTTFLGEPETTIDYSLHQWVVSEQCIKLTVWIIILLGVILSLHYPWQVGRNGATKKREELQSKNHWVVEMHHLLFSAMFTQECTP